jgi:hypothetical protein
MEDSLKRLKRVRGDVKSDAVKTDGSVMSDDDKIRLQLYADVVEFGASLMDKFSYQGDEHYQALFKLVDEVRSQIET